jgi:hydroxypyruvate reductase
MNRRSASTTDPDRFMNDALRVHPYGRAMAEVMAAALDAVDPAVAVGRFLRLQSNALIIGEERIELHPSGRVLVVGGGKACAPMARAACEILGERAAAGIVVVKDGHLGPSGGRIGRIELLEASHPAPDARGVAAATRIASLLQAANEHDLVLALLSGGGSALLTLPASGLSLFDIQALIDVFLRSGATIGELNCLRKHCLQLAGGGLARLAAPAQVAGLILSDVVGSPLDVIVSGPTVPDPTTYEDAWNIVTRHGLEQALPPAITNRLQQGLLGVVPETAKATDPIWGRVHNTVIASNISAAEAAVAAARDRGFAATLLTTSLEGEAADVGAAAAATARRLRQDGGTLQQPVLVVAGGETTVTLRGNGFGGRNQELALGAVPDLAGIEGVLLATLATDGGDGPTDAAGAVVTGETDARAQALNLDAREFLHRNDAYNFFAPLGALLRPGPTLTNVNDLLLILVAPTPPPRPS